MTYSTPKYPHTVEYKDTNALTGSKDYTDFTVRTKRIAIMFYGQWRTGDYCLDYIEDFYNLDDNVNVEVDFFVSLKDYVSYGNCLDWVGRNDHWTRNAVDDTNAVIEKLMERFNIVSWKILPSELEFDILHEYPFYKAHHALLDAIMLKSQYEAKHNIQYDVVIAQRFDVLTKPKNAFKILVDHLVNGKIDYNRDLGTNRTSVLFVHSMHNRLRDSMFSTLNIIQDLWMVGTNNVFDIIAAELFTLLPRSNDQKENHYNTKYIAPWRHFTDAHAGFRLACDVNNIPTVYFPKIDHVHKKLHFKESSPYFMYGDGKYETGGKHIQTIASIVVRESELTENGPPEEYTDELLHQHFRIWSKT